MGKKYYRITDLYYDQKSRFGRLQNDARIGFRDLSEGVTRDALELMQGGPAGKARLKLLRQLGNPFGRGANALASTPTGRFRGASLRKRKQLGMKGQLPYLPIGSISGRLRRAVRLERLVVVLRRNGERPERDRLWVPVSPTPAADLAAAHARKERQSGPGAPPERSRG